VEKDEDQGSSKAVYLASTEYAQDFSTVLAQFSTHVGTPTRSFRQE
jgi:hypothetical protein